MLSVIGVSIPEFSYWIWPALKISFNGVQEYSSFLF